MIVIDLLILALSFVLTYACVAFFRHVSVRRKWVDVPNERSSHGVPTPTGGGLVIVLVSLLAYLIISITLTKQFSKGYFFGALIIAVVSWSDDLYSLSVAWRLFAHIVA